MFGVVQQGVGVAAPFSTPSGQFTQPMQSKTHSSVRHKSKHTALAPFRDDTRLVALRYDQTVALEPPIPLPPPRSPLRPSHRPTSCIPSPAGVAAPGTPPRRPPPPAEQHPALRTITSPRISTSRTFDSDSRRHSGHAPTTSSRSYTTCYEADSSDEDDDDPFAYEKINTVTRVQPLQLKAHSAGSSIYSHREQKPDSNPEQDQNQEHGQEGEGEERVSEADSRPSAVLSSPALSDGGTVSPASPASPATPPPHFSKRFGRSFSFRSGSSRSSSSMKRLRKKALAAEAKAGTEMGMEMGTGGVNESNANIPSSPLPLPDSWKPANPIHASNINGDNSIPAPTDNTTPSSHAGPSSPVISTNIPCESFFEEDDLSKLSFSIRGSLIFGGKRPWKTSSSHTHSASNSSSSHKMADKDAIPEQSTHEVRVFPLVPTATKRGHASSAPARPPRQDDMGVSAIIQKPLHLSEAPHKQHVLTEAVNDTTSTTRKLPPSIRVISAEAEKESQKVRSLYEFGESLQLGDGEVPSSLGEPLEPAPEVPSDVDENDARKGHLPGHHTQTLATTSSPARQDNPPRRFYELAGGIEDWEGVEGHDVDRYGFIVPHRPDSSSRPSTATPNESSPIRFSSRKHRNVLTKKDAVSLSLSVKRGPAKKLSARSLDTQDSEVSTASRRSVRSTIRQATNKLPHNRDRRLVDEAGDILAIHPGLSHINEDEGAEKVAAELKRKEAKRSEKWRKMAKVVKPGSEGQGTVFHFDMKHPKLVSRTWKGIPDCWRSAAWYSFLATSAKADLINYVTDEELKANFHRLVEEPSPDDTQIDLDVPRTINQHIMFRKRYRGGQRLLFRVLHALSLYFPETGYVQGMAPLAATLLSYYDEEQCFVMLVRLWQFRGLNRIYQSGFVELMGALKDFEAQWLNGKDVAEKLVSSTANPILSYRSNIPKKELCIDPTAYATRWYLTLFNLSIPFPAQLRVWDVFMLLGSSPPERPESSSAAGKEVDEYPSSKGLEILHAASLAIIDTLQPTLIDSDFENAMKSLTSWVPIKDEQRFLEIVQVEWKQHQSRQKKKS
ncbi:rab-GTPase-TBC domain-containing protein [Xylariaceae sp. FL1651]|nr:rab-GTPase-TBC domain-containing protein [Xylariaceae sp. FL1651]